MESQNIVKLASNALNNKKAKQLKALKIDDLTTLADYFVIATATSSTHVRALADEVEEKLEEQGVKVHHIEGRSTGWIILDYTSVIVHIFTPDQREFYNLDNMWSEATEIDLSTILNEAEGD
ncbi:MAG: ribosome silencing factor [Ruminococcaceae bacterium]|nr:ribosome silencing factor [Oscillospiraceae bacterium]